MLGPTGHGSQYKEIGRAIATLMADEIFHDVAYKARNKEDLLDGVDEFLDQIDVVLKVTVHWPPGEWDPTIRIEPPNQIPSQEKRKQVGQEMLLEGVRNVLKDRGKERKNLKRKIPYTLRFFKTSVYPTTGYAYRYHSRPIETTDAEGAGLIPNVGVSHTANEKVQEALSSEQRT
ncbi:hypothetical protein OSTOST_04975 [Ostertagia ostertagi]